VDPDSSAHQQWMRTSTPHAEGLDRRSRRLPAKPFPLLTPILMANLASMTRRGMDTATAMLTARRALALDPGGPR